MRIKAMVIGLAAGSMVLAAGGAGADPSSFEEPIRYRRAVMTMIKWHADQISPLVRKPQAFNRDEILRHATYIEVLSRVTLDGFVPDSHQGDTKAKPEIWQNRARFKSLNDRFQAEAVKLRDQARTGDAAAVKAQLGETNKACKACHDDFKSSKLLP